MKGYDFAIQACAQLRQQGYDIRWYAIGTSPEEKKYHALAMQYGLSEVFRFLGEQENPYIYLRQADLYVQPSRFEGKSIALLEAKILCKPIVVTRFSTAAEQIEDERDGLIVDMDARGVYQGIKRLLDDATLCERLIAVSLR